MIPILLLAGLQAQALTLQEAERRAEAHQPALTIGEYEAAAANAVDVEISNSVSQDPQRVPLTLIELWDNCNLRNVANSLNFL